jgi:hypothetical protein
MNKTIAIIIGVVAVVMIIGWVIVSQNSNPVAVIPTPVPPVVQPPVYPPKTGLPIVSTGSKAIPTDTTAVLTGSVMPNGTFTNYWYEYGTTPAMGNKTTGQTIGSGNVSINAPSYVTGLTKNTIYYFRLNAENQNGQVSNGQYSFTTTNGSPAPTGTAPTAKTISANGLSKTTANLNGEVTPNQGDTKYWFEYGSTPSLGSTSAFVAAGSGTVKILASMSLSDLATSTTYYFRLDAQNQFGTVNGAILNFKTK